jgi:peptidyl-prolyl cis-trans isomerase C
MPASGPRSAARLAVVVGLLVAFGAGAAASYYLLPNRTEATVAATPAPAPAEPAPPVEPTDTSDVVARVNGKAITEKDLEYATNDFAEQLARVPEPQRREAVLNALVDLTLVAQAAEKEGLGKNPEFARRIDLLRTQALRSEFVREKVAPQATDEAVRKRFDDEIAKLDQPEEVKASHILVETEDEAKAIIEQLKGGGDFAAIAKEKSKDPGSAANGGDLGYFGKGSMVQEFEAAAFALEPGKFTETPVKSQFGYHIIRLDDRRKQPLPEFDAVKAQVQQLVMSDTYTGLLQKMKADGKIEIIKPLAPLVPPQPDGAPAAGDASSANGTPMDANPLPEDAPAEEEGAETP